jgi:rhamnulokinase
MPEEAGVDVIATGARAQRSQDKAAASCLAVDCGASSCRLIGLTLRDDQLSMRELAGKAQAVPAFRSLINPDDPRFFNPDDMVREIRCFCRETDQPVPEAPGELVRCAYDSLSLLYSMTLEDLSAISGRQIKTVHIVGGGSQVDILNQLTASAIGLPVLAGPVEATALGNGLAQLLAMGTLGSVDEARALLTRSFTPKRYEPQVIPGFGAAYQRFLTLRQ